MCDCIYCLTAKNGLVDFPKAVVGMTVTDAKRFLDDHKKSYTFETINGMPQTILCLNYSVYLEMSDNHIIAAHG